MQSFGGALLEGGFADLCWNTRIGVRLHSSSTAALLGSHFGVGVLLWIWWYFSGRVLLITPLEGCFSIRNTYIYIWYIYTHIHTFSLNTFNTYVSLSISILFISVHSQGLMIRLLVFSRSYSLLVLKYKFIWLCIYVHAHMHILYTHIWWCICIHACVFVCECVCIYMLKFCMIFENKIKWMNEKG